MLVVIATELPPAVRGRMKLWFIEPRPNVFICGLKDHVARKVVDYLFTHCPARAGLTIFKSQKKPPGYEILTLGTPQKPLTTLSGLQLVIEKQLPENQQKHPTKTHQKQLTETKNWKMGGG